MGEGRRKAHRNAISSESEFELRTLISRLKPEDVDQEQAQWLIKVRLAQHAGICQPMLSAFTEKS